MSASTQFKKHVFKPFKPTKIWIDGTIFKINDTKDPPKSDESQDKQSFNINTDETGKYFTSFRLPTDYYKTIFKHASDDLKSIEETTTTNINIPDGNILITGDNYDSVAQAREKLHLLISDIRKGYHPYQFISIPTLNDEIKSKFCQFKDEILLHKKTNLIKGLDESIFQKSEKLHLTVQVFSLMDNIESNEAVQQLINCKTEVICPFIKDKGPILIKLNGVHIMNENGNINKVDVLYTKPQFVDENEEFNMQQISNNIADYFYDKGLVTNHKDAVKLHVTLMNTKYRKATGRQHWKQRRIPFDASYILEKYKDYDFGECIFDTVHLSLMGEIGDDGFYKSISTIKF